MKRFLTYAIIREYVDGSGQQRLATFESIYDTHSTAEDRAKKALLNMYEEADRMQEEPEWLSESTFSTLFYIYFIAVVQVSSKVNRLYINHANRLQGLSSEMDSDQTPDLKTG
ncbi:hypothetical protein [Xanthocytophaga agilis]|uniref:Uncharacterized protein n=1 Tax=Xanthocytophaga agilis TaxID=3048010 RepID=A0AAE3UC32_9BACT|nr:hypothetical protein [Xanthocytophaga agilis]MDJ1500488.1 hypothetical protein [Xanthocytophaga agilis]